MQVSGVQISHGVLMAIKTILCPQCGDEIDSFPDMYSGEEYSDEPCWQCEEENEDYED